MKNEFIDEVNKITNDKLRKACINMVDDIHDYFWNVPASSSGKYHPQCDLGDGGLVRHSIMVCHVGLDLLNAEIFVRDTNKNKNKVRIACLFHDILKQGTNEGHGHTVFEHPIYATNFIRKHLSNVLDDKSLNDICNAVSSHMGKWNTSKYSRMTLPTPKTNFEKLILTAHYNASR